MGATVAGGLLATAATAQTVVHNVDLANPTSIEVADFLNSDGSLNEAGSTSAYQPNPEENPDDWVVDASATFGASEPGSFSMTLDPVAGAHFELQVQNLGPDVVLDSGSFLLLVSGLEPMDPDYELSGVEFSSAAPYDSAPLQLLAFPELDTRFGSFPINGTFVGVLAIAIDDADSFNFLSGTNLTLSGTFDAIDTSAVPEPAVAALALATGAAGFVVWRRRKNPTT
ncbi:MAG TPA: hypothetical protein VG710_02700 [Opitutus sp.]|nr:hypothetical protein [Opitutus sp.]